MSPREIYIKKQRDLASKKCTQYQKMRKQFLLMFADQAEQETDEEFCARMNLTTEESVVHV